MVQNFIVWCIQSLKNFSVLKVGQMYNMKIDWWNCVKNTCTLKDWYIIIFTLELENAQVDFRWSLTKKIKESNI
jgi:hypothetical protein